MTHTQAGQRYYGSERTVGGWFVATTTLKDQLVAAGLPSSPPGGEGRTLLSWPVVGLGAAFIIVAFARGNVARRRAPTAGATPRDTVT